MPDPQPVPPKSTGTRDSAWQKPKKDASRHPAPCSAGRAGAHRPSEALHPTRSSDVLPRIARERVPTVPHVAKTRRNGPRRIGPTAHFESNDVTMICETVHQKLLRRDAVYTTGVAAPTPRLPRRKGWSLRLLSSLAESGQPL